MTSLFPAILAVSLVTSAGEVASKGNEGGLARFFPGAGKASLIRQIDGEVPPRMSVDGGEVRHSLQELPTDGMVRIDSEFQGDRAGEVPFLDLVYRSELAGSDPGFPRIEYRTETWYGSTFWSGPDWTRVGKDWQHPGEQTPSVRAYRCPRDGRVTVSGRVYKLHKEGDGVRVSIRHGERVVWSAEIEGADGKGVEHRLTLDVKRGDVLRFTVHKRGTIYCDTTYWAQTVAHADGERSEALASFGERQGNGGWYYEMEGDLASAARKALPVLRTLGADGVLREEPLPAGRRIALGERETAGWVGFDDAPGSSGLFLGIEPGRPWTLAAESGPDGTLRLRLTAASEGRRPARLPAVLLAAHDGPWAMSLSRLAALSRRAADDSPAGRLGARLREAHAAATVALASPPDLDLLVMAQGEYRREDRIDETPEGYRRAVADHLGRAKRLLDDLGPGLPPSERSRQAAALDELARESRQPALTAARWRSLYTQVRLRKRDVALLNPLLRFDRMLFSKRVPPSYSHHVGQYFGWRQRPGGGLFVLERPGRSLAAREVVGSKLPSGSYLEPCLSYDARRVVFSYVDCTGEPPLSTALPVNEQGTDTRYFHIYEAALDGSGLTQLTRGPYDDLMPAYLPDGGVVFSSTRRRGYSRCFGPNFSRRWHSYTLHRMEADGTGLRLLSPNDVNEWFPAVAHDGSVLFARWDYIDRDAVTHQNLWAMRPDGSNPVAVWGNATPVPHCTFQAKSVPGSHKVVFVASAHHAITAGPVCLLDPSVDANSLDAVRRITPGPFPEAESSQIEEYYEAPWPLSEEFYLAAYSPVRLRFEGEHMTNPNPDNALGLYLIDAAGNRELLYRDPRIGSTSPTPLVPRPIPPALRKGASADRDAPGEVILADVYQGLGDVPRGKITAVRVVQILPKSTWIANDPQVGVAGEENTRVILGTAPVEADGSARFLVPPHRPLLFQALDADGCAYQTMRSTTSLQPREVVSCVGCHEPRGAAPPPRTARPLALSRAPSVLAPGELGGRPFSFAEVVQPVLDRQCVRCHEGARPAAGLDLTGQPRDGFTRSYVALCNARMKSPDGKPGPPLVPRYEQRNQVQRTPPGGQSGALGSGLMTMLRRGHAGVVLGADDLRRLAAWVDCNAIFHGSYSPADREGELRGARLPLPAVQ